MPNADAMTAIELTTDAELVAACLDGDREAFERIVERYQSLLCSLAYSATGCLSESEDLAQEAFVDAWRQLHTLREPEKLRSWLCGILRYKVGRLRRSDRQEPVRQAEAIELAEELPSDDQPVADLAMDKEEQAILWSALERVPELYREPLVLYYRDHRSVEHVAVALDLTEDAVKQRLARGRKILQERVFTFVEGALSRSSPGRVFTLAVLAALPAMATPAKAAGIGTAVAQGTFMAKSTGLAALLASTSGAVSAVLSLRASLDQARTPRERRAVVKITLVLFFGALGYLGALYLLRAATFHWWENRVLFAWITQVLVLVFVVGWPVLLLRVMRRLRKMRSEERRLHPELFRDPRDQIGSSEGEYRSRLKLFGVPLVHIRFSSPDEGDCPGRGGSPGGIRTKCERCPRPTNSSGPARGANPDDHSHRGLDSLSGPHRVLCASGATTPRATRPFRMLRIRRARLPELKLTPPARPSLAHSSPRGRRRRVPGRCGRRRGGSRRRDGIRARRCRACVRWSEGAWRG